MDQSKKANRLTSIFEVLWVSLKLGLTSFGGPVAHLGYFHDEYVRRKKWLDERSFADLVALCQFLPGPASSQVGIGIGTIRAGLLGGFIAWLGFTLPSVIALVLFALVVKGFDIGNVGWIHGLKIVAVAIVAQAILGMGQKLTPDRKRVTIAIVSATITLIWQTTIAQIALIALAALIGVLLYREKTDVERPELQIPVSRTIGLICLVLFFAILVGLPILRGISTQHWLALFDSFYRSGSLVFGGGHVVLPLLEREMLPTGWVSKENFLSGYGVTQAVPGPLFTFASYLGAINGGILGAAIATFAIFLPAYLLVIGTLPFWNVLRSNPKIQGALTGINSAVVGILLAAFYNPIWTSAIIDPADFALAAILFILLVFWKLPPWVIVIAGAIGGTLTIII
ncbi:putative chromate transport protein [Paenibacillus allorhizoplanae]|uniref:Chromate transport protein n=1 Tax=Paenibacillus allorhizoplanae TaxID=2905648 RepID=A0ABM9CFT9_9BACL|nr:chromate transporter [Paenibacillus allorhizoplanae]CAH1213045.1 putative chromate transport protein [Paenibacillus allorhizoplanae]